MVNDYIKKESLSNGFSVGINNITQTKIFKWRINKVKDYKIDDIDRFIEHLQSNNLTIIDWDTLWFKVQLKSDNDIQKLYNLTIEYKND